MLNLGAKWTEIGPLVIDVDAFASLQEADDRVGYRSQQRLPTHFQHPLCQQHLDHEIIGPADLLREAEKANAGVAIGSYPFFKDGRYGANFVLRSDDGALVERTAKDLERRLSQAGIEPFPGGI